MKPQLLNRKLAKFPLRDMTQSMAGSMANRSRVLRS
jgi:hypothetical protein